MVRVYRGKFTEGLQRVYRGLTEGLQRVYRGFTEGDPNLKGNMILVGGAAAADSCVCDSEVTTQQWAFTAF